MLPLNKGGEKMLQRDADWPTSAYRSSTAWGEPAPPPAAACPSLPPSLPPAPWCLYPPSCYKGSRLINRKNHEETVGRVSRIVEETLETCRPLDRREGMLWRAAAPAPSSCGRRFLPTAVHASFDQLRLHLVPSWGNGSRVPPDPPA